VQDGLVQPARGDADLVAVAAGRLDKAVLHDDLVAAGVEATKTLVDGLAAEGRDHAERRALEDAQRALVAELDAPSYELPLLAGGIDLGGLYDLAARLREQGLA